jgi:hypothetical protein
MLTVSALPDLLHAAGDGKFPIGGKIFTEQAATILARQ